MDKPIIDNELWRRLEPLLPQPKASREKYPGRKPVPDRAELNGIVFVLRTGLRWRDLPAEMGCGSGVTCWRRLRDWQEAGVWVRISHQAGQGFRGKLDRLFTRSWTRISRQAGQRFHTKLDSKFVK